MSGSARRSLAALALQLAAAAALVASLLGAAWLDPRSQEHWLLLVDRSDSMPRADTDRAAAAAVEAVTAAGAARPEVVDFAGQVGPADGGAARLAPWSTNIEAALLAALQRHAQTPLDGVVLVSDGFENQGQAARALDAARQARLPLQWLPVARPEPRLRLLETQAPPRALPGQRIPVRVQLAGRLEPSLRVRISLRSAGAASSEAVADIDAAGFALAVFAADRPGAWLVDVALEDAAGRRIETWTDAALVDVQPRAALLYAQGAAGAGGALYRSLRGGGWTLDALPAAQLDARADALASYRAVVLDDVAVADAGPRFWDALAQAVKVRGLGLLVLGGERSFAHGGYRGSALEPLLPVRSEPAALGEPAAVVFAVDKSGSMGEGSGGVDRFGLAQRAVLETARGLGPGDALGLLVFDVAPRVLVPLGPAAASLATLQRDWPASPHGGTRLAPALDMAIDELERTDARRVLVLVTDGFVDEAPLAALRARLERSRIETIALAVGPDADVAALQRLVGDDAGLVRRVGQAADLPQVMRSSLERRRARIERGNIGVRQDRALPFPPGRLADWPPVASYAVTRARPEAEVAVLSERGDPLIAFHAAGHGRVAAVTSGLGGATPQWLAWREWPLLAGGLADWALGSAAGSLRVTERDGALQVELDRPRQGEGRVDTSPTLTVDTPATQGLALPLDAVAPGRWRALLPDAGPGLYSFVASDAQGSVQLRHLRRLRGESQTWGTSPALRAWQAEGRIERWDPQRLAPRRDGNAPRRPPDRSLIALGLALFIAGIVVDRAPRPRAGAWAGLRRWAHGVWRRRR